MFCKSMNKKSMQIPGGSRDQKVKIGSIPGSVRIRDSKYNRKVV